VTTDVDLPSVGSRPSESELLRPYVPRLVVEWLRSYPEKKHIEREATLLFVDISGFTALTELLAKRGKIGAEVMRDTLDGVFTALLDEAYDWGAGLLKWGGDALLLFFDGPQHRERATRAAWELQRTIDRVGRLHLSGKTLILRMSAGIGTGTFNFFLVGSVHRELLIAGPAMTDTLAMEVIADAGEVGLSPALAALLDPALLGPRKDEAILLAGPPSVERVRAPDVGDVSKLDIAGCIPVAARAHVLLQRSEPEHRTITAAFIDMMDTDRLLAEIGPDGLAEGLEQRMGSIEEAALSHEVPFYETDVGKSSVKALLTAGAPSSTGHDEERMLRTLRQIMEQPGVVPMRIGVNTGKVFTGDFGPRYRRAYRVFGDAINTAARVMSKAEAGQILSTEIVLDRSRTMFETTPIEPFKAKGKAELVKAFIVGPAVGTRETEGRGLPLVGRDEELRAALEVVERARRGTAGAVEIVGEAGIGKTRLLDEVLVRAADFRVFASRCEEYERSTAYFPLRAIFRDLLSLDANADAATTGDRLSRTVSKLDATLRPWLPLLGLLLGLDLPPTPETAALDQRFLRERLAETATRLLAALLADKPAILAIEDAHFMDEATGDLLGRLRRTPAVPRQLLLVTSEAGPVLSDPDADEPDKPVLLSLLPLGQKPLTEIVNLATEDAPLHAHEVEAIADRSGGNPLFLFELLDTVRTTGTVAALPASVEALIAGEIDRLAPTDRTIVRYAAVLGASFDPDLLVDAVRDDVDLDDAVWDRLGALLQRDPTGSFRFRSTLMRDTAYEGLPYRRRRALHDRVGETIELRAGGEIDDELAVLALHFHEAQRWDKSWEYNRRAGERAIAIYANVDATRFYGNALAAGRRLRSVSRTELASLYEQSSDALYRLGEFKDADHALRAARRLVEGDQARSGLLVVKQAMLSARSGRLSEALSRLSRALRPLEGKHGANITPALAKLTVTYAGVRYLQNRLTDSISYAEEAIRLTKQVQARDVLAQAYQLLDLALTENGEIEKARYGALALAIFEELGDVRNQASTLNNLGLIAHARSEWDESRRLYERSIELFAAIGDREKVSLGKFNVAEILRDQGHFDDAEALLRDAIRTWRASGSELDVASANAELGILRARRGDFAVATEHLRTARDELERGGAHGEVLTTDVKIAELHVLAGETEDALRVVVSAIAAARTAEGGAALLPALTRLRGLALAQAGKRDEAKAVLEEALAAARGRGDLYQAALVLDALLALELSAGQRPAAELDDERRRLFDKLQIVAVPQARLIPAAPRS
jgi:predicted ATPase/class 3 adenylate cyclase